MPNHSRSPPHFPDTTRRAGSPWHDVVPPASLRRQPGWVRPRVQEYTAPKCASVSRSRVSPPGSVTSNQ
jgi:hypothetical protein